MSFMLRFSRSSGFSSQTLRRSALSVRRGRWYSDVTVDRLTVTLDEDGKSNTKAKPKASQIDSGSEVLSPVEAGTASDTAHTGQGAKRKKKKKMEKKKKGKSEAILPEDLMTLNTSTGISKLLEFDGNAITVKWQMTHGDGSKFVEKSRLTNFFLRAHCLCTECVNGDTLQRNLDPFSIPTDIQAEVVTVVPDGLQVKWANDGHVSLFAWDWLRPRKLSNEERNLPLFIGPDSIVDGTADQPSIHYDEVMADDHGVAKWTYKIKTFGWCFVNDCPIDSKKSRFLFERIAHNGLFNFYDTTNHNSFDPFESSQHASRPHTNTPYFTSPVGLHALHLLSSKTSSTPRFFLVDGLNASRSLEIQDPGAFKALATIPVSWHTSRNGSHSLSTPIHSYVLHRLPTGPSKARLIRWNMQEIASFSRPYWAAGKPGSSNDQDSVTKWYLAARKLNKLVNEDKIKIWLELKPGRPIIYDNWRMLHGWQQYPESDRFCGGYINYEDFISRWKTTNFTPEEVLRWVM